MCVPYTVIPGSTIRKPPIEIMNDMGSDKRTDETPARWEPASAVGPKNAVNKEEIHLEAEMLKSSPSNFSRYHTKNVCHYSCIQIRLQTLLCWFFFFYSAYLDAHAHNKYKNNSTWSFTKNQRFANPTLPSTFTGFMCRISLSTGENPWPVMKNHGL